MMVATGHDTRMAERLRAALGFAGVGAWEWDLRTGEAWWSDHLYAILGRRPDAIPTTLAAFLECVVDEDREGMRAALRDVLQTGQTRAMACRVVRPDGSVRACRGQVGSVPDETGACRLILGSLRDMTFEDSERRAPEEALVRALREQRAELLTMIESAPRPLLLVDAMQRVLRTNRATEEMFGWRAGDLAGRGLQSLSAEPAGLLDALLVAATAPGAVEPVNRQVSLISREGRPFTAEMTVTTATGIEGARFVVMFAPVRRAEVGAGPVAGALESAPGSARGSNGSVEHA